MKSIGIVGAGAIGSAFATHLAAAGHAVTLFARGNRLKALADGQLTVRRNNGPDISAQVTVRENPPEPSFDVLVVATKSQSLPEALPTYLPSLRPDGLLMPLVNGVPWWYHQREPFWPPKPVEAVDPGGVLVNLVKPERIVGSVVFLSASLAADGSVSTTDNGPTILGPVNGPLTPAITDLAEMLNGAGLRARVSESIRPDIWTKIALNLASNPLSVVTLATLQQMFNSPDLQPVVAAILKEVIDLALADGIRTTIDLPTMLEHGRGTGPTLTSMAQDYQAGRPLELAAITDAVFEIADALGHKMPSSRAVASLTAYLSRSRIPTNE